MNNLASNGSSQANVVNDGILKLGLDVHYRQVTGGDER
jgi:hypothetical protein